MEHLLSLFVRSIFVDNMIFAYFLGDVFLPGSIEERKDSRRSGCSRYFRVDCNSAGELFAGKLRTGT